MTEIKPDLRIALAQVNLCVGDIRGNTGKIIEYIKMARDDLHADMVIFPELAVTSYPPEDLLYRRALYTQIDSALKEIMSNSGNIKIVIGHPYKPGMNTYNACSLISDNETRHIYLKQELPNYGVFDEKRYFEPGAESCIFECNGVLAALSICEDIWEKFVCYQAAQAGAKLMINLNASPFQTGKLKIRQQLLKDRVSETGLNIVYVNLVGGQDELVFDGGSMVMDQQGEIIFQAPQFEEGLYTVDFSIDQGKCHPLKAQESLPVLSQDEIIYQALVLGVRDYVRKNGFPGVVIGLSGGIDSALTVCIAVDALGNENVTAVIMPSRYTSKMSIDDAEALSKILQIKSITIPIEPVFNAFTNSLAPVFSGHSPDITEENIQARCRGVILMAISNKTGQLVLTTGNKSEMAVGYATLYGDMVGGFAPLKDLTKTLVYKLCNWRNRKSQVIPQSIIERPPTAELRENQLDRDTLPPYEILDPILERYIELDQSPEEIINAGFMEEDVKKVVLMMDRNEYKRRQAAPGIIITPRAFGRNRRYPITSGYRE